MKYILGIDIGTGSTKAVAVGADCQPLRSEQQHYPTVSSKPGYSEQNPELIWKAFVQCVLQVVDEQGSLPEAVSLSSAMHSLIAVDRQGIALAPMMTWADARSAEIGEQLRATETGMRIYRSTGTPIHAMSPLCKLIWLYDNQQEVFNKAYKFISIKEYIWFRLFGAYEIDHSIASCTGLFNIINLDWDTEALGLAKVLPERLSRPVRTGYLRKGLAPSASSLSALDEIPFVIGASDGCLANLGTAAIAPGTAALTIGTSGAIRVVSKHPVFSDAMTFSYLLDEQTYICGGPVNNGGVTLQWLLKNILGKPELSAADYDALFARIDNVKAGSDGLLFLPYLSGERAPIWDASSCGTFFGLRLQHHQSHLARAVLEGVCYALKDVLDAVAQHTTTINQIHVSGGFVHSRVWMQVLSDITGKELVLLQTEDASAVGAAYLAMKAIGIEITSPTAEDKTVIRPDLKNHQLYLDNFSIYKQLYQDLKSSMHRLQELNR